MKQRTVKLNKFWAMKNFKLILFLLCIIIFTIISCKKENSSKNKDFKYLGATLSNCNSSIKKSTNTSSNDTAWYSIKSDSLDIFLGYNTNCCSSYNTSYLLRNDTIFINIIASKIGSCNCICYNTFGFKFYAINITYFFSINFDNYRSFQGKIIEK
jgi:hypothetical protein